MRARDGRFCLASSHRPAWRGRAVWILAVHEGVTIVVDSIAANFGCTRVDRWICVIAVEFRVRAIRTCRVSVSVSIEILAQQDTDLDLDLAQLLAGAERARENKFSSDNEPLAEIVPEDGPVGPSRGRERTEKLIVEVHVLEADRRGVRVRGPANDRYLHQVESLGAEGLPF